MLYLVATPIGNRGDITHRALEVLKCVDKILCEDTRHTKHLLDFFNIQKPLISYHQFSEAKREEEVLSWLREGQEIALVTDAGTPAISDPGERLVKACIAENLPITACPGPCALIHALVCSGLPTAPFQFIGFFPKKQKELEHILHQLLRYEGVTIAYESPHRLLHVIETLSKIAPQAPTVIARELTKKFETLLRGTPLDLLTELKRKPAKGEIVVLIQGGKEKEEDWSSLSLEEHVSLLEERLHLTKKEAIAHVATLRHLPKRDVYNALISGQ